MTHRPSPAQLSAELKRTRSRKQFKRALRSTVFALFSVLILSLALCLVFPVVRMSSSSMENTLSKGDLLLSIRDTDVQPGDVILFNHGEKLLVKRLIAMGGDTITLLEDGTVEVNGQVLEESYVTKPSLENCTIELPFTVPEGQLFVMGDCRANSLDSRNEKIGTVAAEQVVGKVLLRIWPLQDFLLFQ